MKLLPSLCYLMLAGPALALPTGQQVQSGSIQINSNGTTLQIQQTSPQGIINWSTFSLEPGELVRFLQPLQGVTLNRVVGDQASLLQGAIQANGSVFLLNPNGILITSTGSVQAASFVASTLSMSDADFLARNYRLSQLPDRTLAAVVNRGEIRVDDGGYVVLTAPLVSNEGLIVANQGTVALGASTAATLSFDPGGLIQLVLPDGWHGQTVDNSAMVLLTREQLSQSLGSILGLSGEAATLNAPSGVAINTGRVEVGAGAIVMDSSQATLNTGTLSADHEGGAGSVQLFSAGSATLLGSVSARGGGGLVEVSARNPNLWAAPQVEGGTLYIDPVTITLVDGPGNLDGRLPRLRDTDTPNTGTVSIAALEAENASRIELNASNSINWLNTSDTSIDLQPGTSLSMTAGTILSNPGHVIRATGNANLSLNAVNDIQAPGLHAANGDITIETSQGSITLAGDLTAPAGQVSLSASGAVQTGTQVISADRGVDVTASTLLGAATQNYAARVDTPGTLHLSLSGPENSAAGAAGRVQGSIGDTEVSSNGTAGKIFVNGQQVNASPGDDSGISNPSEDHGTPPTLGDDSLALLTVEDHSHFQTILAPSVQSSNGFVSPVSDVLNGGLVAGNPSLVGPTPVPLYTLALVTLRAQPLQEGMWEQLIEQFVIWEDDESE